MELGRRTFLQGAVATTFLGALGLAGCTANTSSPSISPTPDSGALTFDGQAWNYDETNDVYWQIGTSYVASPAAADFETLGIFVPGAYLTATPNSDGSYAATVNDAGSIGDFTARTAPIVLPVNTPGYSAQQPPTSYSHDEVAAYLEAGFVYVAVGMRGKDSNTEAYTGNAPWGLTDLKAAVRYLRYNNDLIPGDQDRMFVFGHSGGGAQSSVMGTAGDSPLYTPYLESLGAAMSDARGATISDAIAGVMAWCPITSLDYANAAYEWNMGQFASTDTRAPGTWTAAYSKDLAAAFGEYINQLGLKDSANNQLSLDTTASGVYLSGSYYDHVVEVITQSLNDFLSDTTFPYTPSTSVMAGMPSGGTAPADGGMPSPGETPGGGEMPSGDMPGGGGMPGGPAGAGSSVEATTYDIVEDYIAYLNADTDWVSYDSATNTATLSGLAGFVASQKPPTKSVGAFDAPDRSATENVVHGLGEQGLHFAAVSRDAMAAHETTYSGLSGWDSAFSAAQYDSDFAQTDSIGKDVGLRVDMYNPMFYLSSHYNGFQTSTVAPHWRIRTGIMQGDTASTTEVNLALALANSGVGDVDFATVWGMGHTMAERTGEATANFIAWVKESVAT